MDLTLSLTEAETEALQARAGLESRPADDVARQAIREYIDRHTRRELLDRVLDSELARYAEVLEHLGQ